MMTGNRSNSSELDRLMSVLESDEEECWPLYEEVGRIVVSHLLEHDRSAVRGIIEAWFASSRAHGELADTWPDSPQYGTTQFEAEKSDAALFALIRKVVFSLAK